MSASGKFRPMDVLSLVSPMLEVQDCHHRHDERSTGAKKKFHLCWRLGFFPSTRLFSVGPSQNIETQGCFLQWASVRRGQTPNPCTIAGAAAGSVTAIFPGEKARFSPFPHDKRELLVCFFWKVERKFA